MNENQITMSHLVQSTMTQIPEGLESPYLRSRLSSVNHLFLLIPDDSTDIAWWQTTRHLSRTVNRIKTDCGENFESLPNGVYKDILGYLRRGACKLYLWKAESSKIFKSFVSALEQAKPKETKKRTPIAGVAMESWGVCLPEHPEFTLVISLDPSKYDYIPGLLVQRAMKAWKKINKDSPEERKAFTQYAKRNQKKLQNKEGYVVVKLASYSSRAVFEKFRITPSSEWVVPTKVLPQDGKCQHYTHSGMVSR